VLGLSITSTGVGWVLLDGQGPDAVTLDHDAFDVQCGAGAGDKPQHTAAARGAQAIATASGHKVGSVRLTWSEDVEPEATALLKSLTDSGSENVHAIPLSQAARSWAVEAGRASEHAKTALCILEPGTATVMVVATGAGSVRTAVTDTREQTADLVDWLTTIFNRDGWLPECLHLVGSHDDLDAVTGPIGDALPIPVFASVESQLALARGAALATVWPGAAVSSREATPRPDRSRRLREVKKVAVPAAPTVSSPVAFAAAPTVTSPVAFAAAPTVTSPVAEAPRSDTPRPDRSRLPRDVKKVAVSAAAVAAVGAALSLAAGSALNGGGVYMEAASSPAAAASSPAAAAPMTSTSVHAVPAPVSAPPAAQVQTMVAEPPPAPSAPPETLAPAAEHLAAVTPEHVDEPVHQQSVPASPVANVSAAAPTARPADVPPAPSVTPAAAPIVAPPAAPLAVPAVAAPAPIVAPPAAPLAVPAPIAVPPAAPAAPPDPPVPPPPPDPLQIVLSPLFSGLP
jgi:hypothetical protein